ncbi:MAG: 4Fe-4S binding protein [Candidatus Hydrogenedentes bacterium]|nr:4Fe-4S binding protein [Candidatus Hydrogenedentota bacterium]
MKLARSAVVFALGFFALIAQTLLFRTFLTAFEGTELAIGGFFASWLTWVAVGALAGRAESRAHKRALGAFEFLTLAYLPAFVLQFYLIANIRRIAGVQSYELFPFAPMLGLAFLVNAPISLLTGFLFTMACRWAAREHAMPVARVYIIEALGGCVGGVFVTGLLADGLPGEGAALAASLVVAAAAGACGFIRARARAQRLAAAVPALLLALLAAAGTGGRWANANHRAAWQRLLPGHEYAGTFATAQARYLYGQREGQFVVTSAGSVCEALPDTEHASEVAAIHLAQAPDARNVLVVGPGSLAICLRLREQPQIERVVWLHPDPDYPARVFDALPDAFRAGAGDVEMPGVDIRRFIASTPHRFDLVILNLPDATTLVANRYSTSELFAGLKAILAPAGVVSLRISGAANYVGGELACLGASALATLGSAFEQIVLKPGDESWLIASNGAELAQSPEAIRARFAAIPGAAGLYPPEALPALFPPDRVAFQLDSYQEALDRLNQAGVDAHAFLLNTDRRPKALLFSLLLALRQAGRLSIGGLLPLLLTMAGGLAVCIAALYAVLRFAYLLGSPRSRAPVPALFDGYALVFSVGLAGMSLSIVLMFVYQSQYGALFLYIGLITSLFMFGSFLGSLASERFLAGRVQEGRVLLPLCLFLHLDIILAIYGLPAAAPQAVYALLFLLCGAATGCYFPIAAHRMKQAGRSPGAAGSRLELLDHAGGAAGAAVTGLALLPLLGVPSTVGVMALLVAANLVPRLVPGHRDPHALAGDGFERFVRPCGYALLGIGALLVIVFHMGGRLEAARAHRHLEAVARRMTQDAALRAEEARLDDGSPCPYFETSGVDEAHPPGYVFSTEGLARGVYGYAGPVDLAVYVDADGALLDIEVLASHETPAYLDFVSRWTRCLAGTPLFAAESLAQVDALTGATLTSEAILRTLEAAGNTFASAALGADTGPAPGRTPGLVPDRAFLLLTALTAAAIVLRLRPNPTVRRVFLAAALVCAGFWLNAQYSSQHVISLLAGQSAGLRLNGPFFLVFVMPVVVILFGNVYCGYLCPFGAAQELLGDLRPERFHTDPPKRIWRYARCVKYALLLVAVALFATSRSAAVLAADPLTTIFGSARTAAAIAITAAVMALAILYRRFWCRNLCPAGAFLALLNRANLLGRIPGRVGRIVPGTRPAHCDLGVRHARELDCIRCDRCRYADAAARGPEEAPHSDGWLVLVFSCAVIVLAAVFCDAAVSNLRSELEPEVIVRSTGAARDVDTGRIQRMIERGELSDHEADFYREAP